MLEPKTFTRRNSVVKVGVNKGANADLAVVHEFGTADGAIPPRPFIGPAIRANAETIQKAIADKFKKVKNLEEYRRELLKIGLFAASQIQRFVMTREPGSEGNPRLAKETIARKGSTRTLVDTGQLVRSVTAVLAE